MIEETIKKYFDDGYDFQVALVSQDGSSSWKIIPARKKGQRREIVMMTGTEGEGVFKSLDAVAELLGGVGCETFTVTLPPDNAATSKENHP